MSKVFAGYHIVFATKSRARTIPMNENRKKLYAYIHKIITNKKCKTLRINGVGDHIHIALDLNPSVALADLMRDLKRSTSEYMKPSTGFPLFSGWGDGYFAATFSAGEKNAVIDYIKNQEEHHLGTAFEAELEWLAVKAEMRLHPDDCM